MQFIAGISLVCFAASYAVAWLLELAKLFELVLKLVLKLVQLFELVLVKRLVLPVLDLLVMQFLHKSCRRIRCLRRLR